MDMPAYATTLDLRALARKGTRSNAARNDYSNRSCGDSRLRMD